MPAILSPGTTRLKEISTKLKSFNCDQSSLISIETLFLEVLSILRDNKGESDLNELLSIKQNEYKRAQEYYRSIKTKEKAIRQFRYYFKKALDKVLSKSLEQTVPLTDDLVSEKGLNSVGHSEQ